MTIVLLATFFLANLVTAIKMSAFEMGRSIHRRVLDTVMFLFWGSLILIGLWLTAFFRWLDKWAA